MTNVFYHIYDYYRIFIKTCFIPLIMSTRQMFIGRSGETIFSCVYGLTVDTSISVECSQYHKMQQGSLGQKKMR